MVSSHSSPDIALSPSPVLVVTASIIDFSILTRVRKESLGVTTLSLHPIMIDEHREELALQVHETDGEYGKTIGITGMPPQRLKGIILGNLSQPLHIRDDRRGPSCFVLCVRDESMNARIEEGKKERDRYEMGMYVTGLYISFRVVFLFIIST